MKHVALNIFLTIFLLHSCSLVHSQTADPCDNNPINFNDIVSFDTTAMSCQLVWQQQGFTLRYAQAGQGLWSFLLSVRDPGSWVAMGFSSNGQMIGSSAMVGWVYQNGTGKILQYLLKDKDPNSVLPNQGDLTVANNSSTVFKQSGRLYMAFQLSTPQPLTRPLYAIGPYTLPSASTGLKLTQHRDSLGTSINYQTGQSQTVQSPYTGLRRTHGAMNMLGWGILIPTGTIVARYFRQWDPIWFYSHMAIQICGFLFGLIGFMLGFVTQGFIKVAVTHHKNIGITILIFAFFQVMALFVRPQKTSKVRKYWNWYHHNAGRIVVVLAIFNVFYGIHLGMEGASWYGTYAAIIGMLFVTAIVLEIRLWRQR